MRNADATVTNSTRSMNIHAVPAANAVSVTVIHHRALSGFNLERSIGQMPQVIANAVTARTAFEIAIATRSSGSIAGIEAAKWTTPYVVHTRALSARKYFHPGVARPSNSSFGTLV